MPDAIHAIPAVDGPSSQETREPQISCRLTGGENPINTSPPEARTTAP